MCTFTTGLSTCTYSSREMICSLIPLINNHTKRREHTYLPEFIGSIQNTLRSVCLFVKLDVGRRLLSVCLCVAVRCFRRCGGGSLGRLSCGAASE